VPGGRVAVVGDRARVEVERDAAGQLPDWLIGPLPALPSVTLAPFTVSLAVTLAIGVDAVPAIAAPLARHRVDIDDRWVRSWRTKSAGAQVGPGVGAALPPVGSMDA